MSFDTLIDCWSICNNQIEINCSALSTKSETLSVSSSIWISSNPIHPPESWLTKEKLKLDGRLKKAIPISEGSTPISEGSNVPVIETHCQDTLALNSKTSFSNQTVFLFSSNEDAVHYSVVVSWFVIRRDEGAQAKVFRWKYVYIY
jgi:hypothetical protein